MHPAPDHFPAMDEVEVEMTGSKHPVTQLRLGTNLGALKEIEMSLN